MAERTVYIGPYNNHKSDELFNKSIDYLRENNGDKFYHILSNGDLLVKYRKRILEEVSQAFEINLFTFDNIVNKLLEDDFYTIMDGETKEALLTSILAQLNDENKLSYYGNISSKKGFVKILANIIGEIKRSLIVPEVYLSRCPDIPFYTEVGLIYEEYEKKLHELGLVDREESFLKSLDLLKKDNSFFDGLDFVIIDYFFDFRPQELELLKEITKTDCSIYINMPFNRDENFETLKDSVKTLKDLGFNIENVDKESRSYYEQLAEITFSENNANIKTNKNSHIIKAANSYLEMKKVSEKIKEYFAEGTDLNDIAVILTNSDIYKDKLLKVFEEEEIPCSLDKEKNLIEIPLLEDLIHILEVKSNDMDKSSIINRVKSNYFSICNSEEREVIEYILRKQNFDYGYMDDFENIILNIEEETKLIPERGSIKEYMEIIKRILEKYNIEERILDIYNITEDYNLFNRDLSALNKFREILASIDKFLSIIYTEISIEDFLTILKDYLQNESIVEVQRNAEGISILTPVTARGQRFKVVFVVGLSQGNYPNIINSNFFFKDENYKDLKKIGIDVKNYYEKLDKEAIMFTNMISTCSDTLYLSYSQNSTEDEKGIPSMFLDEILNRIEGDKIEDKINLINVDMDYIFKDKFNQITTKKELSKYLLRKYYEGSHEEELFHMYNNMDGSTFKEVNDRILCEIERDKEDFNSYNGLIGDEEIRKDIKNIHKNKIYSISYLESYGKCPYYFLLNNILNVEEMERVFQDFTPLDKGSINHEVLKEYYFNYKDEIKNHVLGKKEFNIDETYDFIEEKIKNRMKSINLNLDSILWKLRIENNAGIILDFIKADLDRLSKLKKKAIPLDFEVPFGRKEAFEVEIDDFKIPFTGVIDRIDKYADEDKYILIDYKNSIYSVKNIDHIKFGVSLQLPLYILSQKDKSIVAGMYGVISTGEFQIKIGHVDEKHLVTKRNKGAVTTEELDELLDTTKNFIKSYIESISNGDFSINPMECSPFCIYKDICRYKEVLEV